MLSFLTGRDIKFESLAPDQSRTLNYIFLGSGEILDESFVEQNVVFHFPLLSHQETRLGRKTFG